MDNKKISVEAQINLDTIDEKFQKVLETRNAFFQAVHELKDSLRDDSFKLNISGKTNPVED